MTGPIVPAALLAICCAASVGLDSTALGWFAIAGLAGYSLSGST